MQPITVYVLCGGKSTRMLSEKGLVLFQGKPFIEHIIKAILPITNAIILVTNGSEYDYLPYKKIKDTIPNKGPLGGIYSALCQTKTDYNLILSCDIPLISTQILIELLNKHNKEAGITSVCSKSRIHPLIGIYAKKIAPLIKDAIDRNELKLMCFMETIPHQIINFDEEQAHQFSNINSPEELDLITDKLS